MIDQQSRLMNHAISMVSIIEDSIDEIENVVQCLQNQLSDLQKDLYAIRRESVKEIEASCHLDPLTFAASPWEPYSEEAYKRLQDRQGKILAVYSFGDYAVVWKKDGIWTDGGCIYSDWPPYRIASLNPSREIQNEHRT